MSPYSRATWPPMPNSRMAWQFVAAASRTWREPEATDRELRIFEEGQTRPLSAPLVRSLHLVQQEEERRESLALPLMLWCCLCIPGLLLSYNCPLHQN